MTYTSCFGSLKGKKGFNKGSICLALKGVLIFDKGRGDWRRLLKLTFPGCWLQVSNCAERSTCTISCTPHSTTPKQVLLQLPCDQGENGGTEENSQPRVTELVNGKCKAWTQGTWLGVHPSASVQPSYYTSLECFTRIIPTEIQCKTMMYWELKLYDAETKLE